MPWISSTNLLCVSFIFASPFCVILFGFIAPILRSVIFVTCIIERLFDVVKMYFFVVCKRVEHFYTTLH
nr:MAG TPA: hypothetical protein [Caudoviricetes sp.]